MSVCSHCLPTPQSVGKSRFFSVGPVLDLGSDITCAVRQLGGDPRQRIGPARGFVLVTGRRYRRLPLRVRRAEARQHARHPGCMLGEAVGLVGEQVIYRELPAPRESVSKALDPLSERGFLRIVDRVGKALRGVTGEAEAKAVRRAIDRLDVDWPNLSGEARGRVVRAANQALADLPQTILPKVNEVLGVESKRVVRGTREGVIREFGLKIDSDLSRTDERIARWVSESQTNFIRDELGRRQQKLSATARKIASEGIAQGLGRDEISRQLREAFRDTTASRNAFYWDVVASAFVNRARSYAEISSYADAGISTYIITAVLDEVTTDICRFLDGKHFSVGGAMAQFERVDKLRDPERIKTEQPWLQVRQDSQGNRAIFVPGEKRAVRAAIIERSAQLQGLRDERGAFRSGLSGSRLEALSVGPPPYHGLCRTTTVPDVSTRVVTPRVADAVPKPRKPKTDGPLELLSASKTFGSSSGQALPLDNGFVENFDVQFRHERIEGRDVTKVRFKVTDQHAEHIRAAILKGERVNRSDTFKHLKGERDLKTGRIIKGRQSGSLQFQAVSSSIGKARVRMVTEKGALTNFIEMDLPTANASEAFKLYGDAAKQLGITDAASFPTSESLDVFRKARLITQYDRQGWEKLRGLKALTPETVDPIFADAARRVPELGKVLDDSKLVQTARGHVALFSKAQATRLQKDGVVGLIHDLSDPESLVHMLTDPDGSGLLSSTQRFNRGLFVNGMSTGADFRTGGADGVFTRIVAKGQSRLGLGRKARVLIDPEQLGRSDWYFFNSDNFGRAGPAQFGDRKLVPEMKGTMRHLSSTNEAMFQHGIPTEALRGVVIKDAATRRRIIKRLQDAGLKEVNGKPLEKFVLSKEEF